MKSVDAKKRSAVARESTGTPLDAAVLKQTMAEVERDEAEAIATLCSVLETIETSRDFSSLGTVRNVVKQWQHRPPRGIVTDLIRIGETLKCQGRDNT